MAYFDSPKNRAFWQKELDGLKKKREAYMNGGEEDLASDSPVQKSMSKNGYLCEEISFEQLNEEVFGKKTEALYLPPQKTMQKELQHEM